MGAENLYDRVNPESFHFNQVATKARELCPSMVGVNDFALRAQHCLEWGLVDDALVFSNLAIAASNCAIAQAHLRVAGLLPVAVAGDPNHQGADE